MVSGKVHEWTKRAGRQRQISTLPIEGFIRGYNDEPRYSTLPDDVLSVLDRRGVFERCSLLRLQFRQKSPPWREVEREFYPHH